MDKDEQYNKQLEEIFNSFCSDDEVSLNKDQLLLLCRRLSLDDGCIDRLFDLAFHGEHATDPGSRRVEFGRFCECFVAVLSEFSDAFNTDANDSVDEEAAEEREVKPRLVRGGRTYGRRTAPPEDSRDADGKKDNFRARAVESDPWVGDMMTSSDDAIDQSFGDDEKLYYESGSRGSGDYFEANGVASSSYHVTADRALRKRAPTTDSLDIKADAPTILVEDPVCNLFSSLEVEEPGSVEAGQLVELWRRGGVPDPMAILEGCGFKNRDENDLIDSCELSSSLEKEALSLFASYTATPTLGEVMARALFTTYKYHLLYMDSQVEHYRQLADKMRDDLDRSEVRSSKMMAEVDDRYLSIDEHNERLISGIERKWEKKLSSANRGFQREREALLSQAQAEREMLKEEMDSLRDDEATLRRKADVLASENRSLTQETIQLSEKLSDAEKDAERLRKDLECLLVAKTSDQYDSVSTSQEEKFAMIIKDYEAQHRLLADRNDELAIEVEKVRAKLRRQEARDHHGNTDLYSETLVTSPKRRKSSRKRSNQSDYLSHSLDGRGDSFSLTDEISDLEHPKYRSMSLDKTPYNGSRMNDFARMAELENMVEGFRNEKRRSMDNLVMEKENLRAELEKEFQIKLERERSKLRGSHDNKAVEEQQAMTMQLLKDMTQQKDKLEASHAELKERVDREASEAQQELAELCREFAKEKAELVAEHEDKLNSLSEELEATFQKLDEERSANQRLDEQLKFERSQHKEALLAHQEIISKFEKSSSVKENDVSSEKLKEISLKHDEEVAQLKRDHAASLESLKRNTEEKLSELLAEKQQAQDNVSMCSELERLQESVSEERKVMHERMHVMREAFEREAVELRHLLDADKAKLRKQLSEEVATLRQRMAEETEREIKRKREVLEEEERMRRKTDDAKDREADVRGLQEEVEALEVRNKELETLLAKSRASLQEQDEEFRRKDETRWNEEFLSRRIEETKKLATEKELENINLRKQLDEAVRECEHKELSVSSLRTSSDVREAEVRSLTSEKRQLADKVRSLEREHDVAKVEVAGLRAKLAHFEEHGPPTPQPRKRGGSREERDAEEKQKEEVVKLKSEIKDLRAKLAQQPLGDVTVSFRSDDDVVDDMGNDDVTRRTKQRLEQTRTQLNHQMKRMKDLYSKLSKTELLVKDLYCENAHLMRGLQVTEARQKEAERKWADEQGKNEALGRLLKQVGPAVT